MERSTGCHVGVLLGLPHRNALGRFEAVVRRRSPGFRRDGRQRKRKNDPSSVHFRGHFARRGDVLGNGPRSISGDKIPKSAPGAGLRRRDEGRARSRCRGNVRSIRAVTGLCRNLQSKIRVVTGLCRNLQSRISVVIGLCRNLQSRITTARRLCRSLQSRMTTANRPCRNLQSLITTANRPCRNLQSQVTTVIGPCRNLQSRITTANRPCRNLQSRQAADDRPCRNLRRPGMTARPPRGNPLA